MQVESIICDFRKHVKMSIQLGNTKNAVYWASKLHTISSGQNQSHEKRRTFPKDTVLFAYALMLDGQYYRAISIIESYVATFKTVTIVKYILAKCYFMNKEYELVLEVVEDTAANDMKLTAANNNNSVLAGKEMSKLASMVSMPQQTAVAAPDVTKLVMAGNPEDYQILDIPLEMIESNLVMLQGDAFEQFENKQAAMKSYKRAMQHDRMCFQAFERLMQLQTISLDFKEEELFDWEEFVQTGPATKTVKTVDYLYSFLMPYKSPSTRPNIEGLECLERDLDVMSSRARQLFEICQFHQCYAMTSKILMQDPYNLSCLQVHVSALKMLDKKTELYKFAHRLVNAYPKMAISWYAIGCYYSSVGKQTAAKRHFRKALQFDRYFGPGWMALGHAFSMDGEHNQAIASYCTAASVVPNSYMPTLYMGMEYSASNMSNIAKQCMLHNEKNGGENDPFNLAEQGYFYAILYEEKRLASRYLEVAVELVERLSDGSISDFWEPLFCNYAYCLCFQKQYEKSLHYYKMALELVMDSPRTLEAIAFVYALMEQYDEALAYLHRAMGLKSANADNSFAITLLQICSRVTVNNCLPDPTDKPNEGSNENLSDMEMDEPKNNKSMLFPWPQDTPQAVNPTVPRIGTGFPQDSHRVPVVLSRNLFVGSGVSTPTSTVLASVTTGQPLRQNIRSSADELVTAEEDEEEEDSMELN